MSEGPKRYPSSDTVPIPAKVVERFAKQSDRPMATEEDVRRALADTVLDAVLCPGCGGGGKVSEGRARILEAALAEATQTTTTPVSLRQGPLPDFDDDDEPPTR